MSILQILAEYILILYGLLGVSVTWLGYEMQRIVRRHKRWEETWSTPSPEQAWSTSPTQHADEGETKETETKAPVTLGWSPEAGANATKDTDPLKAFFTKERVTEPIIKAIKPTKKQPKP